MDRLWAPWRAEFVAAPEGGGGCFLCDAASSPSSDAENFVLRRSAHSFVILNRYPYNTGHLMVVPFRHVSSPADLSDEEALDLHRLTVLALRVIGEAMNPHGFNVGLNLGRAAGAGVADHMHVHVVPRWSGDTNFMPVIAGTKVLPHDLPAVRDLLLPGFRRP